MQLAKRRRPRARGYVRFGRADVYPAGGVTGGLPHSPLPRHFVALSQAVHAPLTFRFRLRSCERSG